MSSRIKYEFSILLIEDDIKYQKKFITDVDSDVSILCATNLNTALEHLTNNHIEMIVCDLNLSGKNKGTTVMQRIQELYPEIHFILLTSSQDIKSIESNISVMGVWQYIKKPWSPTSLKYALNNLILHLNSEREKHKIQLELKASEERFSIAAEATQAGIWDWNIKTNEIHFSDSWKKMLGYEESEVNHNYEMLKEVIHPDELDEVLLHFESIISDNNVLKEKEYRLRHKEGNWIHVLGRSRVLRDKQENAFRIIGSHVDLTEKYEAHIKIQKLNEELESRYEKQNTALKLLIQKLIHRNQFEHLISSISSTLISITATNSDSKIQSTLKEINTFCETESIFIVQFEGKKLKLKNKFSNRKTNNLDLFDDVLIEENPLFYHSLFNEGYLIYNDKSDIDPKFESEIKLLEKTEINSIFLIPIQIRNKKIGFLGMELINTSKKWNQEDIYLLKFIGEILANSYARIEDEIKLIERDKKLIEAYNTISSNEFNARILQSISSLANSPTNKKKVLEEILEVLSFYTKSIASSIFQPKKNNYSKTLQSIVWEAKSDGVLSAIKSHYKQFINTEGKTKELFGLKTISVKPIKIDFKRDTIFSSNFIEISIPILVKKKLKFVFYFLTAPEREFDEEYISYLKEIQRQITFFVERDETKKELKKTLNKEKELGELKSQFVSMASHQFRTPLTVIQSNVDLLHMISGNFENKTQNKFEKISKRVSSEVDRLTSLMNDVLVLGKVNAKVRKPNTNLLDLHKTIKELIGKINAIQEDGRKMTLKSNGQKQLIKLDEKLIEHALTNLIENSFKYSMDKKAPVLFINYKSKHVEIKIQDFGQGIPEKDKKHLFQPFYRASNTGSIKGTGLGLTLSREYILLHNGKIRVSSEINKGTTFSINLPYVNL